MSGMTRASAASGFSETGIAMAGLIAVIVVLLVGSALMLLAGRIRRLSN